MLNLFLVCLILKVFNIQYLFDLNFLILTFQFSFQVVLFDCLIVIVFLWKLENCRLRRWFLLNIYKTVVSTQSSIQVLMCTIPTKASSSCNMWVDHQRETIGQSVGFGAFNPTDPYYDWANHNNNLLSCHPVRYW